MYYEERIINGVLMYRISPTGDWHQYSITSMSEQVVSLKKIISDIRVCLHNVAALNPEAEEIGAGKLKQIVSDAREVLGWEDEQ